MTIVLGPFSGAAAPVAPCHSSGPGGSVQPNMYSASIGERFTQPALTSSPNRSCQNAPWSANGALKYCV